MLRFWIRFFDGMGAHRTSWRLVGWLLKKEARALIVIMASITAAAQQTKPPTYTTEPVTHVVAHCEAGWHLEQWHYGNEQAAQPVFAIHIIDPSGYRASVDSPKATFLHPDRCVKDEPKK